MVGDGVGDAHGCSLVVLEPRCHIRRSGRVIAMTKRDERM
jgi:hypothetical protein